MKVFEYLPGALTFDALTAANYNRCEEVFHSVGAWTPAEWAVAMAGECGEACNEIKKLRRLTDGTNTDKDPKTAAECKKRIGAELADLIIYADLLASCLGIHLSQEIVDKFNAVSDLRGSTFRL